MDYEVTIVNPSRRKRKKRRKNGMVKRNSKGRFVKGSRVSRRRRRNPGSFRTANPRRRRRSSTAVAVAPRRRSLRRRRNPDGGGGGSEKAITLANGFEDIVPVMFGHFILAWGLRTFGKPWGTSALSSGTSTSPYAGQAWPWNNYFYGLGVGYVVCRMLAKYKGGHFARVVWQTICREVVRRFVWTEGLAKIPGAQAYLGGDPPGSIYRDGWGNTYQMDHSGRWQSMQGLVAARPLDGLQLARPLDGLVAARPLDRGWGKPGPRVMNGLLSPDVSSAVADQGAFTGSGYTDPYNAVYT